MLMFMVLLNVVDDKVILLPALIFLMALNGCIESLHIGWIYWSIVIERDHD